MKEKVIKVLEFDKITSMLSSCAVTESGKRLAKELRPDDNLKRIKKLLDETREAESILLGHASHPIASFDEVSSELARIRIGASLSPRELLKMARLLKASAKAKASIRTDEEHNIRLLPEQAEGLFFDEYIISSVDKSIENEETVSDEASSELKSIRNRIKSENDSIRERLNQIIKSASSARYLQDEIITIRNGRYVVPVKQEYRSNIKGLVHGQSGSGATLFIEPMSVVEANNRINELKDAEKQEVDRILSELSASFYPYLQELIWDQEILSYLDLVFAKASLAVKMKAVEPKISESGEIIINKGRHPLINEKNVVPISLDMGSNTNALIITGPNTGGKTVSLKLIGLFAIMMQSGLFLPANDGTSLPVFREVFADIGDEQSIEQSLSTFSSHMRSIVEIINSAGKDSLVLLDELGAGTDPEEGAALAMAILSDLSDRGLKLFATTHYSEIKAFALTAKGFMNACMEFDVNTLSPTYKLITGVAGASNALMISSRLGLPDYIVRAAKEQMNKERVKFDELMLEAERTKRKAEEELEKADMVKKAAEEAIETAKQLEDETAAKKNALIEKANREAYEIIAKAREEAENVIAELKKARKESEAEETRIIERSRKKLSERKNKLEKAASSSKTAAKLLPADASELKIGDDVRIISLGADAVVNKLPDAKGFVNVAAGIMTLNIHVSDIAKKTEVKKKIERTSRVTRTIKPVNMSVNITGKNVEEAYIELDKYLDDAYLSGLPEAVIIHGKGTGTLRSAVHVYLKRHPHIKTFRLGRFGEGEDGVTIVYFK